MTSLLHIQTQNAKLLTDEYLASFDVAKVFTKNGKHYVFTIGADTGSTIVTHHRHYVAIEYTYYHENHIIIIRRCDYLGHSFS